LKHPIPLGGGVLCLKIYMIVKIYNHLIFPGLEKFIYKIKARREGYGIFRVLGGNMAPTLKRGQLVRFLPLHEKKNIAGGEIVVIQSSKYGNDLVPLRIVAVAGDKIELVDSKLYVNCEFVFEYYLNEDFTSSEYSSSYGPSVVPPGFVFALGDCRDVSKDSRYFGPFETNEVVGKVILPV
jgi:signal peptidase I